METKMKITLQEYASTIEDLDERVRDIFTYLYNKGKDGEELGKVVVILQCAAAELTGAMLLSDQEIDAFAEFFKQLALVARDAELSKSEN